MLPPVNESADTNAQGAWRLVPLKILQLRDPAIRLAAEARERERPASQILPASCPQSQNEPAGFFAARREGYRHRPERSAVCHTHHPAQGRTVWRSRDRRFASGPSFLSWLDVWGGRLAYTVYLHVGLAGAGSCSTRFPALTMRRWRAMSPALRLPGPTTSCAPTLCRLRRRQYHHGPRLCQSVWPL